MDEYATSQALECNPGYCFSADPEFVNSVTEEALRRTLPVLEKQLNLAHLMQHLANHSTYHRGQIASMIRRLGAEPLPTDFAFFLLERSSESANAS